MKITGPTEINRASDLKKRKKASDGDNSFGNLISTEIDKAEAAAPLAPVNPLGSLLSIQEVSQQTDDEKATEQGEALLETLEDIRLGLLTGVIPERQILQLDSLVKEKKHSVSDPRLKEILQEIEIRAAVELAKLERARNS